MIFQNNSGQDSSMGEPFDVTYELPQNKVIPKSFNNSTTDLQNQEIILWSKIVMELLTLNLWIRSFLAKVSSFFLISSWW